MENDLYQKFTKDDLQEKYESTLEELAQTKRKLEFLETLVDEFPVPLFAKNKDARFCVLNKAYTEFFNINREDFLGKSVLESVYLPEEYRIKYQTEDLNAIENALETHYEEQYDATVGEKTPAVYYNKGFHVPNSDQKGLVGTIVDITTQKRLELELENNLKELKEAYENPKKILDESPFGVAVFNKNASLVDANQATLRLFGAESKEEFKELFFKQQKFIQEDGRTTSQLFYEEIRKAFFVGYNYVEAVGIHKNGDIIPFEITYRRANLNKKEVVICYIHDLTDTKAIINDMVVAKKVAEETAKTKSEFLANMSHEIRTPLNGVLGLLHILSMTKLTEKQVGYIQKAIFSANNLVQVLSDILDISELDSGKTTIASKPFTLQDICTDVQNVFSEKALVKNIDFFIEVDGKMDVGLIGDVARLSQVIYNLIDNSIKFTKKGSVSFSITKLKSDMTKATYRFAVNDTGIGIHQNKIDALFNAFNQSDTSLTRQYGGVGLGLTICKRLVEMMGGNIYVESFLGEGSNFYFDITLDYDPEYIKNIPEPELRIHFTGDILLVEDSLTNQLVASELLKKIGHKVDIAKNGMEALELLGRNCYDLVLMDIQMPIMDGYTATKIIRANKKFEKLPIIAISAHSLQSDIEKSLGYGMNEHITKPISPKILYKCINKHLQTIMS